MIDYTAPIYSRPDGTYVAVVNDYPYHVIDGDPLKTEIEAYVVGHPEALAPEPSPPEPTAEQREQNARALRDSMLCAVIDKYNAPRWEEMAESEKQTIRDYRKALLDWPSSSGFPDINTIPKLSGGAT